MAVTGLRNNEPRAHGRPVGCHMATLAATRAPAARGPIQTTRERRASGRRPTGTIRARLRGATVLKNVTNFSPAELSVNTGERHTRSAAGTAGTSDRR